MYNDGRLDVRDLISVLIRRSKIILATIGVFFAIAVACNLLLPTWYVSNVNLRVKYNRSTNDGLGTLSQEEIMHQQIYTYAEIFKGKTVVETATDKIFGDLPEDEKPDYETMLKRIEAEPLKNTEILHVTVAGKDPEEAKNLADALVETFLDRLTEIVRSEGRETKVFIGQRMQEAKDDLNKVEAELVAYKEKNKILSVSDQTKNIMDQQAIVNKLLVDNQVAIKSSQAKVASTNRQISEENPGFVGDSPLIQQYKGKLEDMEVELIGLRKNYKPNHPKVQSLQASVDSLKDKLAFEIGKVARAESPSGNPIHQNLVQAKLQAEVDVASANAQHTALNQEQIKLQDQLDRQPQKEQGLSKLLRDTAVAEQSYTDLAKSYDQARIDEVKEPRNVQVVDMPDVATKPAKPRKLLNMAIGLLLGLFTGISMAFISEIFFKTVDTAFDAEKYLRLPVMGGIPEHLTSRRKKSIWQRFVGRLGRRTCWKPKQIGYLIQDREQSAMAEAFRSLRMTLREISEQSAAKSILFVGSNASNENAMLIANAARTLAYSGKKVVLLDCDLRRPVLDEVFQVDSVGLAEVLRDRKKLVDVLQPVLEVDNLMFIASGGPVHQAVHMLATSELSNLIKELEAQFDYVLINSPALTVSSKAIVSDACIIAAKVDAVVLIIEANQVKVSKAQRTVKLLQGTKTKILGTVLNNVKSEEAFFYPGHFEAFPEADSKK